MAKASKNAVYLVEGAEEIPDARLPSIGTILSFFVFRNVKFVSHKVIADLAYERIKQIWEEKAGIYKLKRIDSVKTMLLHLFEEYSSLKATSNAKSEKQRDRENSLRGKLNKLFDISSIYHLDEITDEDIKTFLKNQKEKGPLDELDLIADLWSGRSRKVGVAIGPGPEADLFDEQLESMSLSESGGNEIITNEMVRVCPSTTI